MSFDNWLLATCVDGSGMTGCSSHAKLIEFPAESSTVYPQVPGPDIFCGFWHPWQLICGFIK
ncbi:MAG: hypothetical protein M1366_02795 [Patescibacteria group bacterium]|nr:hypothetical protein [Patescibacteria group bacterium]